jgi:LemA protein
MSSQALSIIKGLYGRELRAKKRPGFFGRLLGRLRRNKPRILDTRTIEIVRVRKRLLTARRVTVTAGLLLIAFHVAMGIYYYNVLTRMEQDVLKEQAKISSLLQRRRNISINLARTVRDYAVHEAEIFRHLAEVRAASQGGGDSDGAPAGRAGAGEVEPGPGPLAGAEIPADGEVSKSVIDELSSFIEGAGIGELAMDSKLSKLLAVAERYPDLKLSENFRNFMDALVETEKELCDERMRYAETVNTFTTKLKTFPGNVFGKAYGFESVPYYEADQDALQFHPVDY